jgi:hypothetical protein
MHGKVRKLKFSLWNSERILGYDLGGLDMVGPRQARSAVAFAVAVLLVGIVAAPLLTLHETG